MPAGFVTGSATAMEALDIVPLDRFPYGFVRTVTTADNPDRNRVVSVESSSAILTGTRCTTFVKLPVALSGGRSANCDPLAGAISITRPRITSPGYTSMRTSTGLPTADVRQLRLAEVRLDPRGPADEGQDLRAGRHQLSRADLPLADGAVGRRDDARVTQVDLRDGERGFLRVEIGDELQLLRLDHGLAAALGFDGQLVAPQQRPRLREVRVSTGELRGEPFLIGHCRLHALPRRRLGRQQGLLARTFRAGAVDVRLHRVPAGSCGSNLGAGLIDAGERALNPRVLEVALTAIVFERRLRRVDRGDCLRDLRAIIVVCQQNQLVSFANVLVVIHLDFTNESDHLRAQRSEIAPDVGIVRHLLDASAFPRVPVARDRERDRERHQHDEHGRSKSQPGGLQRIDRVFDLRAWGRDDWGCGHFDVLRPLPHCKESQVVRT